jgi:transposase
MGRPTKLTPEIQETICNAIEIGATREIAAMAAGIDRSTLFNWIKRGRDERKRLAQKGARLRKREKPFLDFLDSLEFSEAGGEVKHIETIAGEGATGSKWILSRRHPERWAQVSKSQISGPDGGPVETKDVSDIPDAARLAALAALYERVSDEAGE